MNSDRPEEPGLEELGCMLGRALSTAVYVGHVLRGRSLRTKLRVGLVALDHAQRLLMPDDAPAPAHEVN